MFALFYYYGVAERPVQPYYGTEIDSNIACILASELAFLTAAQRAE